MTINGKFHVINFNCESCSLDRSLGYFSSGSIDDIVSRRI